MDQEEIFNLTVDGLKEKLGDLRLSTSERKATLQYRPIEPFSLTMLDSSETDAEKMPSQQIVRDVRVE